MAPKVPPSGAPDLDGVFRGRCPQVGVQADYWGDLWESKEVASAWADRLVGITRMALSPDKNLRGHFHGTSACLSALFAAGRYTEIVDLLQVDTIWPYKRWAVKALAAMGRKDRRSTKRQRDQPGRPGLTRLPP